MEKWKFPSYLPIFRGKTPDGKWVVGYLTERESTFYAKIACDNKSYVVRGDTLSISTNLIDAEDRMIYEGDVIKFGNRNFIVYWNSECFQWKIELLAPEKQRLDWRFEEYDCHDDLGWVAAEIPILGQMTTRVIGNKWDNPELIPPDEEIDKSIPF